MAIPAPHLVTTPVVDGQPTLSTLAALVDAAPDALARLAAVTSLTALLATIERETVAQARAAGASWTAVGEPLGITKQAATKRFGPPRDPAPAAVKAPRAGQSWEVTTPGGRTLLRFVKQSPKGA